MGLRERVVAQQCAARGRDRCTRHRHWHGRSRVLGCEGTAHPRCAQGKRFASDRTRQSCAAGVQHHVGGAVIDFVVRRDTCHCQRGGSDVGRAHRCATQGVVAQQRGDIGGARTGRDQSPRQSRSDGDAIRNVLVCKNARGTRSVEGDQVACCHTRNDRRIGRCQCGSIVAVIDLVGRHQAGDGQRRWRDVGG